jgi:hypothetical protein
MKRTGKGRNTQGCFEKFSNVMGGITPSLEETIGDLFRVRRGVLFQSRWRDDPDGALAFAKRTLEIAAHEASAELDKNTGKDIEDWARSHDFASKAATGIDRAVKHILGAYVDAPSDTSRKATIGLLVSPLGRIYRMTAARLGKKVSIPKTRERAEKDASALYDASVILHLIAEESLRKRDAIAGGYRNPGRPEKAAFVRVMMEGWIFLTGKRPSDKNTHFASFVSAGWTDLTGQEDSSWEQPIRKAHESFSPQDIASIAERVPSWE